LADEALRSEQCATRAKLDAGLVSSKSVFWVTVAKRIEGFPSDGPDGMTFADILHQTQPLFFNKMMACKDIYWQVVI
jgi:hypothetical protein